MGAGVTVTALPSNAAVGNGNREEKRGLKPPHLLLILLGDLLRV